MSSSTARDQFLRQMEQIVEGIKQNRIKVAAAGVSILASLASHYPRFAFSG